ncbi:MAG: hypothetical protein K2Q18_06945 [Bdellovibrionales bacterium]|nr:hypothetical protein [Bdellovibrionales bacterium]
MKNIILKIFILSILFSVASCASKPRLYPNETYKARGKVASDADIDLCLKEADDYMDSSAGKKILKSTGVGAAIGGAIGAVAGAFYGDIGGGAARGAAMGGAGGAVSGALSPDELEHRYVNQCLADKGYHVIGWD